MNLAEIRNKKGMTQAELAEACGITQKAISAIEVARRRPSFEVLIKLAKALGVTIDELVADPEEESHVETKDAAAAG